MTGPDDRESGTKPPEPPKRDQSYLPPRLREKLEEAQREEPKTSSPAGPIIGTVVVIVVLALAGWWFIHAQQVKKAAEAARVAAQEKAVADSLAAIKRADSLVAVARADSIAAFSKLPKWKQRQVIAAAAKAAKAAAAPAGGAVTGGTKPAGGAAAGGAAGAGGAAAAPAVEKGPFAIDAGSFLFEDKAKTTADALKASTGLDARAVTGADGSFHVYLGKFDSRAAAAKAANDLTTKGLVQEAHVVSARGK